MELGLNANGVKSFMPGFYATVVNNFASYFPKNRSALRSVINKFMKKIELKNSVKQYSAVYRLHLANRSLKHHVKHISCWICFSFLLEISVNECKFSSP